MSDLNKDIDRILLSVFQDGVDCRARSKECKHAYDIPQHRAEILTAVADAVKQEIIDKAAAMYPYPDNYSVAVADGRWDIYKMLRTQAESKEER